MSLSNRRRISLRVNGINSHGVAVPSRSLAQVTTRKAIASIDRMTQRRQEVQVRTWCSSSPAWPLAAWKDSSMVHRQPATRTRVVSGTRCGDQHR